MRNQKLTIPGTPKPTKPDPSLEHYELWRAVKKAVFTLPSRFESELVISGVLATDLCAFNSSLGATMEEQVLASLKKMRSFCDPQQRYSLYSFERIAQATQVVSPLRKVPVFWLIPGAAPIAAMMIINHLRDICQVTEVGL